MQPRHILQPFVMRSVTHALQYSCFSQHGAVTMLPPVCPAVCLQTGQVVLSSVSCSIAFLFPVAFDTFFDASPVGVCELLATARAAASIGTIGTLGGAATTSVPGALLLTAVPSTDGDSDKASIEEVLTAQPYVVCRPGRVSSECAIVGSLRFRVSPGGRQTGLVARRPPESPREAWLVPALLPAVTMHPHCFAYVYDCQTCACDMYMYMYMSSCS